jgi:hypothetical protein
MCICDIIYKEIGFTQKDVFALCVVAPSSERKRGEGEGEREREEEGLQVDRLAVVSPRPIILAYRRRHVRCTKVTII